MWTHDQFSTCVLSTRKPNNGEMNILNVNIRLVTLPCIDSMLLDYFVGPAHFQIALDHLSFLVEFVM